ncbi:MAG: LTA synthase family protein [Candidatus Coprovivens sp.]
MKIFYNRVFKNYFLIATCLTLSEILFKMVSGLSIFDWSIIRIILGVNMIGLFLGFLYSFAGRIIGNILTCITTFIFSLYAFIQVGLYNYIGTFVSIGNSNQINAVSDGIVYFFSSLKFSYWLLFLPFILVVCFYIFIEHKITIMENNETIDFSDKFDSEERKKLNKDKLGKEIRNTRFAERASAIIAIGLMVGFYFSTYQVPFMQNELQLKESKDLFLNPDLPNLSVAQLGYSMYIFADVKDVYMPYNGKINNGLENGYVNPEQAQNDFTREIDDTIWEQIIKDEKNSTYKALSEYFISKEIVSMNDYTGIFNNKNLIMIQMESVNNIVLNPTYYPNIYKLYSEGWSFDNSYSTRNSCSTSNSEVTTITSLYTINNVCSATKYMNNSYPESLFNLFNNDGYNTSSYYNYTNQYYNRKIAHSNMGSGNYYGVQELGIPYSNVYEEWPSDVEIMKKFLKNTEKEDKYMAMISTISTNGPYSSTSELGDLYLDTFSNTGYNIQLKRYMSKLKTLDNAIGVLLDGLEQQGKLDDTVIVLYSDHYPYDLNNKILNSYFDYDVSNNYEVDRTPFIIYNTSLSGTKFDEYTSNINIAPTIANLFGLEYDPRLFVGYDILSKNYENRVVFADGSWVDDVAFFNATTSRIKYHTIDKTYSKDTIKKINESVKLRINMSNLAIKSNYFNYLTKKSGEYKVSPISGEAELITDEEKEQ